MAKRYDALDVDGFPIGHVYFVELPSFNRIKIGSTQNLASRLKSIASYTPEAPTLLGVIEGGAAEEMRWHERWSDIRAFGEWFTATPELRAAISDAVAKSAYPPKAAA